MEVRLLGRNTTNMKQNAKAGVALLGVAALLLAGCTSGDSTTDPEETAAPGGDTTNTSEAIDYESKWASGEPQELLFPRGEYTFTYNETIKTDLLQTWSGEGKIAFYEDGTCAFDFNGAKTTYEGKEVTYRLVKLPDSLPLVSTTEYSETPIWINDPLLIESSYRTNFPVMGGFPRYQDFASFCALQKLEDLGVRGGAEAGFFFWDSELGEAFAAEGKEWYYDFMLSQLNVDPKDYKEAEQVLDLMYYGNDNIFTYDGQGKVETREDGSISISTGLDNPDNIMVGEFVLTPTEEKLDLELGTIDFDNTPGTLEETLAAYVSSYGSGIAYLRDVKRAYDEYVDSTSGESEGASE